MEMLQKELTARGKHNCSGAAARIGQNAQTAETLAAAQVVHKKQTSGTHGNPALGRQRREISDSRSDLATEQV